MKIVISEEDYKNSQYSTKEWEQSVTVVRWEHNFEEKNYTILPIGFFRISVYLKPRSVLLPICIRSNSWASPKSALYAFCGSLITLAWASTGMIGTVCGWLRV